MLSALNKTCLVIIALMLLWVASSVEAAVEWNLLDTISIEAIPLDTAVSPDGRSIYVLTDDGKIRIYDNDGNYKETIDIGAHVDQIRLDPRGQRLFATNRQNRTVQIIELEFIHRINILGSPSKGPRDAPVVIAVFSDFQ